MAQEARDQYEDFATQYDMLTAVPEAVLESQAVIAALGSIKDQTVLDLAGGSGIHARQAVAAGARLVDLVDISSEMLKIAEKAEEAIGRRDAMRFFVADIAGDLSGLGLHEQYDIVMVNWLLDHATSDDDLEGFWKNIARFTKPGGRLICTRVHNPETAPWERKLGITHKNMRRIPGGVAYQVIVHSDPVFEFEATSMDKSSSGSTVMHEKYGFDNVTAVRYEDMEIVKKDPAFWKEFLENPYCACETAVKKA